MDTEGLLNHLGVPFASSAASANVGRGWVGVRCPFCADHSDHLGINRETGACTCWRCGRHPLLETLHKLTGLDRPRIKELLDKYGARRRGRKSAHTPPVVAAARFKLPSGTTALAKPHTRYLRRRRFDPGELAREWGVQGTGPVSYLDGISFGHRVVIPVWWRDRVVSFQARDITDKAPLRYISCPAARERVPYKTILYGQPAAWDSGCGICVEGITDVWRLGPRAVGVFGTSVTQAQVKELARTFRRVAVVFDGGEDAAALRADALVSRLRALWVPAVRVDIEGDPGDLGDQEARALVREVRRSPSVSV